MRTEIIFIIQVNGGGSPEELNDSTDGCIKKSSNVGGLLVVDPDGFPNATNWKQFHQVEHRSRSFTEAVESYQGDDVGLYVVSHASSNSLGSLNGSQVGELIREFKFKKLRKVNLLACNLANNIDTDQTFLLALAKSLADGGMKPMIACYVGFNTTATDKIKFNLPKQVTDEIRSDNPKQTAYQNEMKLFKQRIVECGRTLVRGNKGNIPLKYVDDKSAYKKVVQINDDLTSLRMVPLTEWTDK
jgi:hypothetical protein